MRYLAVGADAEFPVSCSEIRPVPDLSGDVSRAAD